MNNNKPTKEQQEFIAYLKKKYKDLDEKKLKQLKESGQLEKDAAEFKKAKEQTQKTQTQKAAHGVKLDYIKTISHKCPEGQELYYFKVGGKVGCGCKGKKFMQDGGKTKESIVDKFKKSKGNPIQGMKKTAKAAAESSVKTAKAKQWSDMHKRTIKASGMTKDKDWVEGDKCGGKVKKHQIGGKIKVIC